MMMISPEAYISRLQDATYEQLLEERDELFSFVTDFEQGRVPESEYVVDPSPDVVYQVYLEYLAVLCKRIAEVYNRDYVWGSKED